MCLRYMPNRSSITLMNDPLYSNGKILGRVMRKMLTEMNLVLFSILGTPLKSPSQSGLLLGTGFIIIFKHFRFGKPRN